MSLDTLIVLGIVAFILGGIALTLLNSRQGDGGTTSGGSRREFPASGRDAMDQNEGDGG